jgi:hypothetical protein
MKTPAGEVANVRRVQLWGLEAHFISQLVQEGKEGLRGRFALCHPPLSKAPPAFLPAGLPRRLTPAESEVLHGNQQRCLTHSLSIKKR